MNQVNEESKSRALRFLAVLGFLAIIIIATWLAVQVVRLLPAAFNSLASLAESVEEGRVAQNTITIDSEDGVINNEEAFTIEWNNLNRAGTYAFRYDCTGGVAANLRINGAVSRVNCGESFVLPKDTYSIDALFTSERNRFTDVTYYITFTKVDDSDVFLTSEKVVTVVNAEIPQGVVLGETDNEAETTTPEPEVETPAVTTPSTPAPTPAPVTPAQPPKPRYTVTYKQPVSDPNGYTDLAVRLVAIGTIDDGEFEAHDSLEAGKTGAIQFEVKNAGTKTSTGWEFEVELPNGAEYESDGTQEPLKPNERATLTVVFSVPDEEGEEDLKISVTGGGDTKTSNNTYSGEVEIED